MKMNFNSYLQKILQAQTPKTGISGVNNRNEEILSKLSLFTEASAEELANIDMEKLLEAENAEEALGENATAEDKVLAEMVKALMELDGVQSAADADGDGKLSAEEATAFLNDVIGKDGDISSLTMEDIDTAIEELGIDLQEVAEETIEEVLNEDKIEEIEEAEEIKPAASTKPSSSAGGASGAAGGSYNGASAAVNAKSKAETIEEIEQQISDKNAEIDDVEAEAEAQIKEQEEQKEAAMKQAGVSEEEYKAYQEKEQELENKISDKEDEITSHKDTISNNEATISSNKNYIGNIEAQISANQSSMGGISDEDENASDRKAALQSKIDNLNQEKDAKEAENKKLEDKNKEEQKAIDLAEKQKTALEQQKAELLETTLDASKGFGQGMPASESDKLKANIAEFDEQNSQIRQDKEEKVASLRSDIQDLNVQLQDAKEEEERNKFLRENSPNDAQSILDLADSFNGKTQAEMREIMQAAGYRFDDGLWCADFVSFIAGQTIGEENLADWYKDCNRAGCTSIMNAAKENGAFIDKNNLQAGDAILFDWDGAPDSEHIGYVVNVVRNDDGSIAYYETIEGNTSGDNAGSQVAYKKRYPNNVLGGANLRA